MPPPYPEAYRETGEPRESRARKRAVNSFVVGLSFLHLRRPRKAPAEMLLGRKLSSEQWATVRRFERLLEAWLIHPLVTSETLGRNAAKVEEIDAVLSDLEAVLIGLFPEGTYNRFGREDLKPGQPPSCGVNRVGKLASSLGTSFKKLDPDRISFIGEPSFDPAPYLDKIGREIFLDPLRHALLPWEFFGELPAVQVHIVDGKRDRFLDLLDASGRLALFRPEDVRLEFLSGVFAVGKDSSKDRMILDARRPNALEHPIGRWIRSLASGESLCRLILMPGERLVFSGNDVRDFYHLFKVPKNRSIRNSMNMFVPEDVCRNFRAYDPELHAGARYLIPSLNTLAMGDCQAVEIAQTCHLSMAWRSGALEPESTLTLAGPPPRSRTFGGIVIDDFVCAEKVGGDFRGGEHRSGGAKAADLMSDTYVAEGLIPHPGKAFRDLPQATFWGTDVDGEAGLVRASLVRAIPLMHIIFRVVTVKFATARLLQVISGSLVSIFIYKSRLLSLLNIVFAVVQHHEADDIIPLGPELQEELVLCALMIPLAVSNIRAAILPQVYATDASGWGEAEVEAEVPSEIAREGVRHSLRKSVWTRLLGPTSSLARLHGTLDPSEELPEGQQYSMHPLWEVLTRCPRYRTAWKAKSEARRHINVSELRAFLRSERRQARHHPSSRALRGSDSQVTLGCVQKGRSSSLALNSLLQQSVPCIIGADVTSESFYVDTRLNRADDPTRGLEVRGPDLEMPEWWSDLSSGNYTTFDKWLEEAGETLSTQLDIPSPCELLGDVWSRQQALPRTEGPRDLTESGSRSEGGALTESSIFGAELIGILRSFSSSLFVWPQNRDHCSTWVFNKPGYLDLFAGRRGVAKVVSAAAATWSLCIDIRDGPDCDLLEVELREKIERLIQGGVFFAIGAAIGASSFSVAVQPAVRTSEFPAGLPNLHEGMAEKVANGNLLSAWLARLVQLCLLRDVIFWIENPARSWLWRQSEWKSIREHRDVGYFSSDMCAFGAPWKKPTKVLTNSSLRELKINCPGCLRHLSLRGYSRRFKQAWTRVSEPFPKQFSGLLGEVIACYSVGSERLRERLDLAACAKITNEIIGEASHPGPRPPRGQVRAARNQNLDDVKLVSAQTEKLQERIWSRFQAWVIDGTSPSASDELLSEAVLLSALVCGFGKYLFSTGESLYLFRHLILAAVKRLPALRQHTYECWNLVSKWEVVEPLQHRAPLPEVILRAMVCLALLWKWERVAGILLISFWGISRPGEALRSLRSDMLLPSDLCLGDKAVCYLKIRSPKTGRRTKARVQHISVRNAAVLPLLERVFKNLAPNEALFPGSPSAFRRRWDSLLDALLVPKSFKLTPGGLRGGGAVAEYHRGTDLATLQWRMRIRHQVTLEAYLQEVAAENLLLKLPPHCTDRVKAAASLYDLYLLQ
ncbi:Rraga [Symbiodinium sp. CCMP2592]|nr:Rraga [Symbiodinium sp. CCMP2592]